MTDYEAMWRNSVEEVNWLTEQIQRLKGDKRENPTLRDQFAMAALTGFIINNANLVWKDFAPYSYDLADEMMKARERE